MNAKHLIEFLEKKANEEWGGHCQGEYGCLDDITDWVKEFCEGG